MKVSENGKEKNRSVASIGGFGRFSAQTIGKGMRF